MDETRPTTEPNPWAERLLKAERENHCGDLACQTRRTSAAVRVLTGWKEHQDYCWAVEAFEVEIGVRDPATVGKEPDNIPSRAAIEAEAARDALAARDGDLRAALRKALPAAVNFRVPLTLGKYSPTWDAIADDLATALLSGEPEAGS
jgi:hypothetical protein